MVDNVHQDILNTCKDIGQHANLVKKRNDILSVLKRDLRNVDSEIDRYDCNRMRVVQTISRQQIREIIPEKCMFQMYIRSDKYYIVNEYMSGLSNRRLNGLKNLIKRRRALLVKASCELKELLTFMH